MVPSLDTYLYKEIEEKKNKMLSNCYIMNEVLKEVDDTCRANFISAYCGDEAVKEVKVFYGFPQNREGFDACFAVTLGDGDQRISSLGGIEGDYTFDNTGTYREKVVPTLSDDESRINFVVQHPIGELQSSPDFAFSVADNTTIQGNTISIRAEGNEAVLSGSAFEFFYSGMSDEEVQPRGLEKGYTSVDTIEITPMSTNYDTVRCLDVLLKTLLIMVRESIEESNTFALQQVRFGALGPIIEQGDLLVYGRTVSLNYTVSYSVPQDFYRIVSKLSMKERGI